MARWQTCNVLQVGAEARRLWRFAPSGEDVRLEGHSRHPVGQPLPPGQIRKDWRSLWQKKLNIAWIPADQVFLRVLQLPAAEPAEVVPMVDLQLERLSPIPVNQVVWAVEVLPSPLPGHLTAVVLIAERRAVEEFLGRLEGEGYLPDRLDLPQLHQMLAVPARQEGVWVHLSPSETGTTVLVAWWLAGALQHLSLFQLPTQDDAPQLLTEQLTQHAWAGEIEGWYVNGTPWHLVVEPGAAGAWETALRAWAGSGVQVVAAPPPERVAAVTATRAASSKANLLPPEHALRYRQQFIDGLWMRGLFAILGVYVVGVIIYFAALQVLEFQRSRLEREVRVLQPAYQQALQLKDRIRVLQEQVELRFAALDCWKAICEFLPAELTLTDLHFSRGQTLKLVGTVSSDDQAKVTEFNSALRKAEAQGYLLFDKDRFEAPSLSLQAGGSYRWAFGCDLKRGEIQ